MGSHEMNSAFSEEVPANIWVEIEVKEDDDGLNCCSGLAEREQIDRIVGSGGECPVGFLRLDHVLWTRTDKESEWASEKRQVVELGKGRWGNHKGTMYFRTKNIILISPLHGGAELQRRYVKEN